MKYIGEDKAPVEYTIYKPAGKFEDSDNMPDDPENNWDEEIEL